MRLLLMLAIACCLAACARRGVVEALVAPEATVAEPRLLDTAAIFEASEGRGATFERRVNGSEPERVRRVILRDGAGWRVTDSAGNWLHFARGADGFIAMTGGQGDTRRGEIRFEPPLVLFAPVMREGEALETSARWTARPARIAREGDIHGAVTFAGVEPVSVPAGEFPQARRVDASFLVKLPLGFSVRIQQSQWVDGSAGEVRRRVEGELRAQGVGLRSFEAEYDLVESRALTAEEREALLSGKREQPEGTVTTG